MEEIITIPQKGHETIFKAKKLKTLSIQKLFFITCFWRFVANVVWLTLDAFNICKVIEKNHRQTEK